MRQRIVDCVIESSGPHERELARLLRELATSDYISAETKSRLTSAVGAA